MQYILLDTGYQEVYRGQVVRHTDLAGNTIPAPESASVIDANPPAPLWALPDPVEDPAPVAPSPRRMTRLGFVARLGEPAFFALLAMAKQSIEVEAMMKLIEWAQPDPDGTSIDLDDPRFQRLHQLEPALVQMGVVAEGWAAEVLNA